MNRNDYSKGLQLGEVELMKKDRKISTGWGLGHEGI